MKTVVTARDPIRRCVNYCVGERVSEQMECHCLFFLVQLPRLGTLSALSPDADVADAVVRIQGPSECACTSPHRPSPTEQNPTRDSRPGRKADRRADWLGWRSSGSEIARPDPALFVPCRVIYRVHEQLNCIPTIRMSAGSVAYCQLPQPFLLPLPLLFRSVTHADLLLPERVQSNHSFAMIA